MFKKKILIIDDTELNRVVTTEVLTQEGYEVVTASNGEDGIKLVKKEKPDLVILDVVMPGIDGFEVCKILREDESNNLMPIIMLTVEDNDEAKLIGLELGADDYVVKPFNSRELASRVRNTLKRIDRNRLANPLTGLQGNLEILNEINRRFNANDNFAVIYLDLDNFKAFNDAYGFTHGDRAIKLTADIILDNVKLANNPGDFVGHVGGDDFVVITSSKNAEEISKGVIVDFDKKIVELYSQDDVKNQYIKTVNRLGEETKYPIMTISIAIVANENKKFENPLEMTEQAAQLKKIAKSVAKSIYVRDRRKR